MKASTLLLSAAFALAGAASSLAQVITFDTITPWSLGAKPTNTFLTNAAIIETFKLPATSAKLDFATWRFVAAGSNSVTASSTFAAYFTEWNTTTKKPTGAALWQQTGISLTNYGTGFQDVTLSLNYLTDPSKTYSLILIGTSVATNVSVARLDGALNPFPYGEAYRRVGAGSLAGLISGASFTVPTANDWGFTAIQLTLTPIPETGTVAVAFAGILVVGLGVRRRMHAKSEISTDPVSAV